jgi:bla regulator protein blaR1
MHLLFVEYLFTGKTIQAIGWTLIHSLWEGLLLAIVTGAMLMLTKRSSPALRYNLLSTIFILFVLVICFTFQQAMAENAGKEVVAYPVSESASEMSLESGGPDFWGTFADYFNKHASLIVAIWFVIFCAKCVEIMAGMAGVQRIRNYKVYPSSGNWVQRLEELADKLRVRQKVELLQSAIIKIPVTVGLFKPVIIIPLGLLSDLPSYHVEAILLHELAHIRRKDYFINLLQSFVEVIFFFNPAILWISSLIREERESCCDDLAITEAKSKKHFIHALVAFQEYRAASSYAMAFSGKKQHLLNRVKRIVNNRSKTLNPAEKIFLIASAFLLMISLGTGISRAKNNEIKMTRSTEINTPSFAARDTILVHRDTLNRDFVIIPGGEITIPADSSAVGTTVLESHDMDEMNEQAENEAKLLENEVELKEIGLRYREEVKKDKEKDKKAKKEAKQIVKKETKRVKEETKRYKEDAKQAKEDEKQAKEDAKRYKEEIKHAKERKRTEIDAATEPAEKLDVKIEPVINPIEGEINMHYTAAVKPLEKDKNENIVMIIGPMENGRQLKMNMA